MGSWDDNYPLKIAPVKNKIVDFQTLILKQTFETQIICKLDPLVWLGTELCSSI